jgi:hypothetical protein
VKSTASYTYGSAGLITRTTLTSETRELQSS